MALAFEITVDDPARDDVRTLLDTHLSFSREATPPAYVFALDSSGLSDPAVTFFSARVGGELVGIGALKRLDDTHAELKSMHTRAEARRQGVGRAMVLHLLAVARAAGLKRVSLETGTMDEYAPARALYAGVGFTPCQPFGEYEASPYNTCMTLVLDT
jgi:putative acetyltransferase